MPTYNANVVIHIDESLSSQEISQMEQNMGEVGGILCACVHEKTPHLMVVDYDPNTVSSSGLLQTLQGRGLHAELIGGI